MRRIQTAALVALLAVAAPMAALAHVKLTASNPKHGSVVAPGLSDIELDFSAPLRLSMVHVRDGNRQDVPLKSKPPTTFAAVVKINVDGLGPGSYEVSWTAVAEDGHVMKGSLAFSVQKDAGPAQ